MARRCHRQHRRVPRATRRVDRHACPADIAAAVSRQPRERRMGRTELLARADRERHGRRSARRHDRSKAALHLRLRDLHPRIDRLRTLAHPRRPHRFPCCASTRRRDAASELGGSDRDRNTEGQPRSSHRHPGCGASDRPRARADGRRVADRRRWVAVDLLSERSGRGGRLGAGVALAATFARPRAAGAVRLARAWDSSLLRSSRFCWH